MKKQNGITLIALVITIIVLLILAGVTISLLVGDNGILTQSTSAVLKNNQAKAVEDVTMAWASADTEYFSEWTNNPKTRKAKYFQEENLELYLEGKGYIQDGIKCLQIMYLIKCLYPKHVRNSYNSTGKKSKILKLAEDLNSCFSKEDLQMFNRYIKGYSASLIIKEMQITVRMAINKRNTNNKC